MLEYRSLAGAFAVYAIANVIEGMETDLYMTPINRLGHDEELMTRTNWCFGHNTPKDITRLGAYYRIDRCCRLLTKCVDYILPGEWKYGLQNNSPYKRFSCECDGKFYGCLKIVAQSNITIESELAEIIGDVYFHSPETPCYWMSYNMTCEDGYYDIYNHFYKTNEEGEYFCAFWYAALQW